MNHDFTFFLTLILPFNRIFLLSWFGEGRVLILISSQRLFVASISPSSETKMSAMIAYRLIKKWDQMYFLNSRGACTDHSIEISFLEPTCCCSQQWFSRDKIKGKSVVSKAYSCKKTQYNEVKLHTITSWCIFSVLFLKHFQCNSCF